ncbi:angelicin synthase-like [Apium graveolens]|uniref:angelicin synthase-like n=1 Tax=Apium graveolens TaxID=4045 RepID=UPI003D7B451A
MLEQYSLDLSFFALISVTIFLYKWLTRKTALKNFPPSPPKFPIIGNLHQIGPDLHISLRALAQNYGPLMLLKFGSVPVLVVSSASAAREIIKTHDLVFSDRPITQITNRIFYKSRDVAFSRYSEYWRQVKSTLVTQLLSRKKVHSFSNVIEEEIALLIQNIKYSDSKIVNLSDLFIELTSNVVCRAALGKKYASDKGNSCSNFLWEITELLGYFSSMGDYIPLMYLVDWLKGFKRKVERVANEADAFLEHVIKDHQNSIASDNSYTDKDFVSFLLKIQTENTDNGFSIDKDCTKALIMDILFAGIETPATTLEWTMAALIKNPDIMFKLKNEVREVGQGKSKIDEGDLDKMNYLKAVLKESMRLYMPAPLLLPKESRQDVNVMGYDIEARTQILINAWAIARDPSLWDNPEEFWPERFLNNPIDYKGLHYEYLPFGGGRRICPGIHFATAIIEHAIANIVHNFDFELPDGERLEDLDMTGVMGINVRKKSPLLVIATPHV